MGLGDGLGVGDGVAVGDGAADGRLPGPPEATATVGALGLEPGPRPGPAPSTMTAPTTPTASKPPTIAIHLSRPRMHPSAGSLVRPFVP